MQFLVHIVEKRRKERGRGKRREKEEGWKERGREKGGKEDRKERREKGREKGRKEGRKERREKGRKERGKGSERYCYSIIRYWSNSPRLYFFFCYLSILLSACNQYSSTFFKNTNLHKHLKLNL